MSDPIPPLDTLLAGAIDARNVADAANPDARRQKLESLAQEFEAMLMTQMLREMRQAMLSDEEQEPGLGNDVMTDTMNIELGRELSHAGGFGLVQALTTALSAQSGEPQSDAMTPEALAPIPGIETLPGAATSVVAPGGISTPDVATPGIAAPTGPVSSAFGWRRDPFTAALRFHGGIDIAQAYGQDVRAAADGRVVFAGTRGGYGTMVVVEHAGGRQTRYAHLSQATVAPGDAVGAGQVIGKSGSSGRSTGPHLHFEVVEAGRPVDPAGAS